MAATTLLTSDQFLALPEEFDQYGNLVRHELINGEIVPLARRDKHHSIICGNILGVLFAFPYPDATGLKVMPGTEYAVSENDVFITDVSVVAIDRLKGKLKYIQGAPELAIEVVSPSESAANLRVKTEAYLANGSHSVWIVFPEVRSVLVYTGEGVREFKGNQSITDALLPGFSSPVAAFFELT